MSFPFIAQFEFAETVFRDKSGRKRNLKLERLEQRRKAEKDSERDELYAQWGKGLVHPLAQNWHGDEPEVLSFLRDGGFHTASCDSGLLPY